MFEDSSLPLLCVDFLLIRFEWCLHIRSPQDVIDFRFIEAMLK